MTCSRHVTVIVLLCLAAHALCGVHDHYKQKAPDTLRQVHVLFRDGCHAPLLHYPKDPSGSEADWPLGYTELTLEGLKQQDRLGQYLRRRYDGILSRRRSPKELMVFSTDVDRTLVSAQALLAGLYPDVDPTEGIGPNLPWVPFPVHTTPYGQDQLLRVDGACPEIGRQLVLLDNLPFVRNMTEKAAPLMTLLSEGLGVEVKTLNQIKNVYENLMIKLEANMSIPKFVVPHMPFMGEVTRLCVDIAAYTPQLKLLRGGPLLKKISDEMVTKTFTGPGIPTYPTMFLYSAHKTDLVINLETISAYNGLNPPYASAVIYELHEGRMKDYSVQVLYYNDTTMVQPPRNISLPGCAQNCPLDKWIGILTPYLPYDYQMQCRTSDNFSVSLKQQMGTPAQEQPKENLKNLGSKQNVSDSNEIDFITRNKNNFGIIALGIFLTLSIILMCIYLYRQRLRIQFINYGIYQHI